MTVHLPDDFRFARVVRFGATDFRRIMRRQPGECTWCGGRIKKDGARSWCSTACVDEWTIRNQPAAARRRVHERDRGVCAICGADCDARRVRLEDARARLRSLQGGGVPDDLAVEVRSAMAAAGLPVPGDVRPTMGHQPIPALWEADHIIPVCEGGGFCGLDNFRTLCLPCHREETAKLAARRAKSSSETSPGQLGLFGSAG